MTKREENSGEVLQAKIKTYREDDSLTHSPLWLWYTKVDSPGNYNSVCRICDTVVPRRDGTTGGMMKHLERHHGRSSDYNAYIIYEELQELKELRLNQKKLHGEKYVSRYRKRMSNINSSGSAKKRRLVDVDDNGLTSQDVKKMASFEARKREKRERKLQKVLEEAKGKVMQVVRQQLLEEAEEEEEETIEEIDDVVDGVVFKIVTLGNTT